MRIKIDGCSLNYELSGSGEAITFIHGLGDSLGLWVNQVPLFSQRYQTLTYDVRGFGQSDKPPGEYSMDLLAQDLSSILKALDIEKSIIVGFSMGGVIATRFALDFPEAISGLVIASSSSEVNEKAIGMYHEWIEKVSKGGFTEFADAYVKGRFHPEFVKDNPEFISKWKEGWTGNDLHGWTQATLAITKYNYTAELENIACPTLVMVGDTDVSTGVGGSVIMHQRIAGSQLQILPDIGHDVVQEKPEVFNGVLVEFLNSVAL